MADKLKVTLVKSTIGAIPKQRATVEALGLKKVNKTVELPDNEAVRGMIWHVRHLVKVEEIYYRVVNKERGKGRVILNNSLVPCGVLFITNIFIMKKENYYKWNDASISDIEWEQMMGETDFEYPKVFSSLVHFIKSLSEEEEKAFINKIEKLEMENEEERKKQLLNMKSYFIKIGVRCMEDKYTVKEIKQNLYCHMIMIVYGLLNS